MWAFNDFNTKLLGRSQYIILDLQVELGADVNAYAALECGKGDQAPIAVKYLPSEEPKMLCWELKFYMSFIFKGFHFPFF